MNQASRKIVLFLMFFLIPIAGSLMESPSAESAVLVEGVEPSFTINLNTANQLELMRLKGIGRQTARRIVEYRRVNGPFQSIDSLLIIKGIGGKKLEKIRNNIRLES
jgi:competence protein ComEA